MSELRCRRAGVVEFLLQRDDEHEGGGNHQKSPSEGQRPQQPHAEQECDQRGSDAESPIPGECPGGPWRSVSCGDAFDIGWHALTPGSSTWVDARPRSWAALYITDTAKLPRTYQGLVLHAGCTRKSGRDLNGDRPVAIGAALWTWCRIILSRWCLRASLATRTLSSPGARRAVGRSRRLAAPRGPGARGSRSRRGGGSGAGRGGGRRGGARTPRPRGRGGSRPRREGVGPRRR